MRVVAACVLLACAVLGVRLVGVQWMDRARYLAAAQGQRFLDETIPARPGDIVDRHGRLLAATVSRPSLWVDPSRVHRPRESAGRLAGTLEIDAERLVEKLLRNRHRRFLWVRRRLSDEEYERVRSLELPKDTWGFREEYLRCYPQGRLAAHVLGLRDIDGRGRGGIEQSFDEIIRGADGRRILARDARGRVVALHEQVARPPRHGRTVVLTIDSVIQIEAERVLDDVMDRWKPRSAAAIVVDPQTCQVLAMASRPTFDPSDPAAEIPPHAWTNTGIASMYEPGSTFKPFIVGRAVQHGTVRPDEQIDCEHGRYRMGRRLLHDHHPYGRLSVTDVLVKSSNIGMAKIGEGLANEELYRATLAFGFGRPTGIGLPGEAAGTVRPLKEWTSYSTGSVPMGQEIAVTPIQLLTAHAALANGGVLRSPRLVLGTVQSPESRARSRKTSRPMPLALDSGLSTPDSAADGRPRKTEFWTPDPAAGTQVVAPAIDSEIARWLVEGPLTEAVRRGTGTQAQLEGYTVFGKTGTAQKFDVKTGRYSSRRHVCSFVAGAPADDPQVLVLVVVNEPTVGGPHYGGTVAAPAAAEVLKRTLLHLGVPPARE